MELQAGYEEAVRELHGLEHEREAMLYQVNILEDKLETLEELLFESRREAHEARMVSLSHVLDVFSVFSQ